MSIPRAGTITLFGLQRIPDWLGKLRDREPTSHDRGGWRQLRPRPYYLGSGKTLNSGSIQEAAATKISALGISSDRYRIVLRLYGKNGVTCGWEPLKHVTPHEVGILVEVIADDQEIANAALALVRVTLLHSDFLGRMCKEGNMAFPFSLADIERGAVYEFSMQHVVEVDDPLRMFPIDYQTV